MLDQLTRLVVAPFWHFFATAFLKAKNASVEYSGHFFLIPPDPHVVQDRDGKIPFGFLWWNFKRWDWDWDD